MTAGRRHTVQGRSKGCGAVQVTLSPTEDLACPSSVVGEKAVAAEDMGDAMALWGNGHRCGEAGGEQSKAEGA